MKTDLLDAAEATETALTPQNAFGSMIERLAANPGVDVEKLARLITMQEGIIAHNAKAAFNASFARMQPELPEVTERGAIAVKGVVRSTYAKLEDINEAIRPVLKEYGFAVRHRTEWPAEKPGIIRIVGILSHEQGHSEESAFEAPMDRSEYRTDIQSMGSTVSYGRRYTTLDLLNITTRGADDDGQGRPKAGAAPTAPEGYEAWRAVMEGVASEGLGPLQLAFQKSKREFREHITKVEPLIWARMKTKAGTAAK